MNEAERLSTDTNQEWQSLESYATEHPFKEAPSSTKTEAEEQKTPNDSEQEVFEDPVFKDTEEPILELSIPDFGSRRRYLEWTAYVIPNVSREEKQAFREKFGNANVCKDPDYLELVKNIPSDHPDVFNPSIESVKVTTEPFLELIRQDTEGLIDIAQKLESGKMNQESLESATAFFCEKFGVRTVPTVESFTDDSKCKGKYNQFLNHIRICRPESYSIGNLTDVINSIAHEVWHAHQQQLQTEQHEDSDNNELANKYRLNNAYPQNSSIDYDAYRNQIVEKEAFHIGDEVEDIYNRAYLSTHPGQVKFLRKKHAAWIRNEYDPEQDGLNYKMLIIAYNDFKRNGKKRGKLSQKINNILLGK